LLVVVAPPVLRQVNLEAVSDAVQFDFPVQEAGLLEWLRMRRMWLGRRAHPRRRKKTGEREAGGEQWRGAQHSGSYPDCMLDAASSVRLCLPYLLPFEFLRACYQLSRGKVDNRLLDLSYELGVTITVVCRPFS